MKTKLKFTAASLHAGRWATGILLGRSLLSLQTLADSLPDFSTLVQEQGNAVGILP
ncbi:MAG: hypothetical protein ACI9XK_003150 [Granulosicoccus sp.]|jgi:hypothetical protein